MENETNRPRLLGRVEKKNNKEAPRRLVERKYTVVKHTRSRSSLFRFDLNSLRASGKEMQLQGGAAAHFQIQMHGTTLINARLNFLIISSARPALVKTLCT
jgi:hypothetical protein